ncbi:MAG: hypothetical protein J6M20_10245 [Clostridia bacterium]|nr:hypothetical protein [Clostridia bacterium]
MTNKLKYLVLVNGILTIIGGVMMILYGLELIQLGKPVRIAIVVVLCINAAVNCANYYNVRKQQKAS